MFIVADLVSLKDNIVGWLLRPSSRVFHILMADGIHDLIEILVRVNGVEKLLFLSKSAIYDGTSPLLTLYIECSFCRYHLTDRFVQSYSFYNFANDTDLISKVTIRAASFCTICTVCPDYLSSLVLPTVGNDTAYNLRDASDYKYIRSSTQLYYNFFHPSVVRD